MEKLLSHTLGDEESTDFLLTEIAKPLIRKRRQATWSALAGSVPH